MSNIDKEWLQQKIADMEAARDEIPFGLGEDDSNTLAALRIALASLEAEPVSAFKIDHESSIIKHVKRVVSETNAQPAPVSVPAAMEMDDDFDSSFEHGKAVGWNAYRAAMLQSFGNSEQLNSPVIQDGYVLVPKRLTAENGAKTALIGEFNLEYSLTCHECFGEGCDDCSGEGTWINTIPVDWSTIKDIWANAIDHFTAAPQQEVK